MLDAASINQLFLQRKRELSTFHAAASVLESVYEGTMRVPLPEIDKNELPANANIIQTGLDQHAMRVISTEPQLICSPVRASSPAIKRANQRRLAIQSWWYLNQMKVKRGYRARHLVGYGLSPVLIRPGKDEYPIWEIRSPMETFPAPSPQDDMLPTDCIFAFERDVKWVNDRYPDYALTIGKNRGMDEKVKLLQYVSPDQWALVAMGRDLTSQNNQPFTQSYNSNEVSEPALMMLASVTNRAQCPCVIIPGRITLANLAGQFDQLVGMYAAEAKLWALQVHAVMREVFGETWVQATAQGGLPEIVREADPYEGIVGIVRDGQIQQFRIQSSQGPLAAIDRLERNQRVSGSIPAEMGGEASSNIRTGRRGGQVFSATVDFYVQEHQNLLAQSLQLEDEVAIEISKAYWGDTTKTFVLPLAKGQVSYTPNITFDAPKGQSNSVSYAYAGADSNALVVEAGQRIAQGTLSKFSFMQIDPMVNDPNFEHDRLIEETMEQALMQSIMQQSQDPNGPWSPAQMAKLVELVYTSDIELFQAVAQIDDAAKAQQAQQVAPPGAPGPDGQPTPPGPPGAAQQPGLAQAGAPGTPQAANAGPTQGQQNLQQLLQSLRSGSRGGVPPNPQ